MYVISAEPRSEKLSPRAHPLSIESPRAWDEGSSLAIRWRLRREPGAGAEVRRRLVLATKGLLSGDEQDLLRLLVTELINNAVQHVGADAGTHLVVDISITGERLRALVCDGGPGFDLPTAVPPPTGNSALRGLQLVDRLAARWGIRDDSGNCVWFELDQTGAGVLQGR